MDPIAQLVTHDNKSYDGTRGVGRGSSARSGSGHLRAHQPPVILLVAPVQFRFRSSAHLPTEVRTGVGWVLRFRSSAHSPGVVGGVGWGGVRCGSGWGGVRCGSGWGGVRCGSGWGVSNT